MYLSCTLTPTFGPLQNDNIIQTTSQPTSPCFPIIQDGGAVSDVQNEPSRPSTPTPVCPQPVTNIDGLSEHSTSVHFFLLTAPSTSSVAEFHPTFDVRLVPCRSVDAINRQSLHHQDLLAQIMTPPLTWKESVAQKCQFIFLTKKKPFVQIRRKARTNTDQQNKLENTNVKKKTPESNEEF